MLTTVRLTDLQQLCGTMCELNYEAGETAHRTGRPNHCGRLGRGAACRRSFTTQVLCDIGDACPSGNDTYPTAPVEIQVT